MMNLAQRPYRLFRSCRDDSKHLRGNVRLSHRQRHARPFRRVPDRAELPYADNPIPRRVHNSLNIHLFRVSGC